MTSKKFILLIILLIAGFLRFYNLMWGFPYFFHPDERNMAYSITQFRLPKRVNDITQCFQPTTHNPPARNATHSARLPGLRQASGQARLPGLARPSGQVAGGQPTTCNLNPHFFAYGGFPLYLAYFSDQSAKFILNLFKNPLTPNTSLPEAVFWLRFWSATFSTLTVLLVFLITQKLLSFSGSTPNSKFEYRNPKQYQNINVQNLKHFVNLNFGFSALAALCAAFTPGLIQSAHFGTTESLLTFFFLVLIYLSILYSAKKILTTPACHASQGIAGRYFLLLTSLVLGLSLSTKISSLIFLLIPLFTTIYTFKGCSFKGVAVVNILILMFAVIVFGATSPFTILDFQAFRGSVNYETNIALGWVKVFYTRQFENTVPILFQAQKIFPYALGWPIFVLGSLGFLLMILQLISKFVTFLKHRISYFVFRISNNQIRYTKYHIRNTVIIFSFLIYFLPNAFFFAKWTRFMTPIFPLFSIFAGYSLFLLYIFIKNQSTQYQISKIKYQIYKSKIKNILNFLYVIFIFSFLFFILLPGAAYFTIYARPDVRVTASEWIYQNIPSGSYILSETANVVDIPVSLPNNLTIKQLNNYQIISFNFYELDENPFRFEEFLTHLEKADYIFVPSRRIFANHLRLSDTYPLTSKYYELLFSGNLGFEKVAEFSSSDENAEETFTVFDHPVIRIYQKKIPYTKDDYQKFFGKNPEVRSQTTPGVERLHQFLNQPQNLLIPADAVGDACFSF